MSDYVEIARRFLAEHNPLRTEMQIKLEPQAAAPPEESVQASASPKPDPTPSTHTEDAAEPSQAQIHQAGRVLALAGVRLVGGAHGVDYAGVWSDLDGPELRAAIAVFHPDVPVRYLDGDGISMRYKLRRVPGETVPANVLAAMEQEPDEPWKVRDRMLAEMGWNPEPTPWAHYQAERLNELFREQGATGQPGKVQPETVRHG